MSSFFHRASCFVAILLTTWTACDGAFQTPYCEYFSDREECQSKGPMKVEDMGNGMVPLPEPGMPPARVMKGPVGFTDATSWPISTTRDWVGIHQGNRLVFAEQQNADAALMRYELNYAINRGWNLEQVNCSNCLKLVENFDFRKDYLVTSNSLFYKVLPGAIGASGYIFDKEVPVFGYISVMEPIAGYRPFARADIDSMIFQVGQPIIQGRKSGSELFYQQSLGMTNVAVNYDKMDISNDKYYTYCVGDLDQLETSLSQQEVLTFEESAIANVYHIQIDQSNDTRIIKDDKLKSLIESLRGKINTKFGVVPDAKIRSTYIADLNGDNYADLLMGILNNIYVATYDPANGGAFILWEKPIVTLMGNERPRSIAVSDLDGDTDPDLAVEIFNNDNPDYRKETPLRVNFYINKQR